MKKEDAEKIVDDCLRALKDAGASYRCSELVKILETLGFTVRDGRRGGHKVFVHVGLRGFHGGNFNCGHGKNPEVKPVYVRQVCRLIQEYRPELSNFLEYEP